MNLSSIESLRETLYTLTDQEPSATESHYDRPAYADHPILPFHVVLEGGSMRGLFTAGVLDLFMEKGLLAQRTIGVSAGALVGYNYASGALGRTAYINLKYCADPRYLSASNILFNGDVLGIDFLFDRIPNTLDPFDTDAILDSPMQFTTVASNLETGEADYHDFAPTDRTGHAGNSPKDLDANLCYLAASASMPLAQHHTEVDGKKLLDGGVCDSVPFEYSIIRGLKDGIDKHVIVLTRDPTFVKKPNPAARLVNRYYSDYPYFCERFAHRHYDYNRTYRRIAHLADEGKVFVFQPEKPVEVTTMEDDRDKLMDLYLQGYAQALRRYDELCAYLGI